MTLIEQAIFIIAHLNDKTGRHYRTRSPDGRPTSMAEFVMARLRQGYTQEDAVAVIDVKCKHWLHDERMSRYLTPETLFRKSNFERYLAEVEPVAKPATVVAKPATDEPRADPERIREALNMGWQILKGRKSA